MSGRIATKTVFLFICLPISVFLSCLAHRRRIIYVIKDNLKRRLSVVPRSSMPFRPYNTIPSFFLISFWILFHFSTTSAACRKYTRCEDVSLLLLCYQFRFSNAKSLYSSTVYALTTTFIIPPELEQEAYTQISLRPRALITPP